MFWFYSISNLLGNNSVGSCLKSRLYKFQINIPGSSSLPSIAFSIVSLGNLHVIPMSTNACRVLLGNRSTKSWWMVCFRAFKRFLWSLENSQYHGGPISFASSFLIFKPAKEDGRDARVNRKSFWVKYNDDFIIRNLLNLQRLSNNFLYDAAMHNF